MDSIVDDVVGGILPWAIAFAAFFVTGLGSYFAANAICYRIWGTSVSLTKTIRVREIWASSIAIKKATTFGALFLVFFVVTSLFVVIAAGVAFGR